MDKSIDLKRKSRNLNEKKRRDQFNNLINELNSLTGLPDLNHLSEYTNKSANQVNGAGSCTGSISSNHQSGQNSSSRQRKMDKSSVIRCAMEFLRKHTNPKQQHQQQHQVPERADSVSSGSSGSSQRTDDYDLLDNGPWKPSYITDDEFSLQMLEALDAFIVVCEVSPEAKIIYSSDSLTNLLNYTGTCNVSKSHDYVSLFDLIAPSDRPKIEKLFAEQPVSSCMSSSARPPTDENCENMFGAMGGGHEEQDRGNREGEYISLSVNFRNGLNLNQPHLHPKRQKASNRQQYELIRLMATFRGLDSGHATGQADDFSDKLQGAPVQRSSERYFICIGRLDVPRLSYDLKIIAPPSRGGLNVFHNNQFMSKHTLKWRFLWVDNRAPSIIGYLPFEVLGTSGYDYYHWDDLDKLVVSHQCLMRDGQASSGPYRFLTKGQQWIWLQTSYCIILKPQFYAEQRKCKRLKQQYLEESASDSGRDGSVHEEAASGIHGPSQVKRFRRDTQDMEEQQQQAYEDFGATDSRHQAMDYHDCQQESPEVGQALGSDASDSRASQQLDDESDTTTAQHDERQRYKRLLKSKDLIERQSIKAGNSLSSRSLHQFKFILCTHTVIGYDDSDDYDSGGPMAADYHATSGQFNPGGI